MSDEDFPEDELTEEERREAAALVHALERGSAREALPEDALETAALLRYSRDGGALPAERRRAILEDVFANAKAPAPRPAPALQWLRWLVPAVGVAAAAGAVVVAVSTEDAAPVTAEGTALPAPPPDLLTAQAAAAGGTPREAEALAERMDAYRGAVYAALESRYVGGGR